MHFDDVGFNTNKTSTLWYNPNMALEYFATAEIKPTKYDAGTTAQEAGKHSPVIVLVHEMTHGWMRNINPNLSNKAADAMYTAGSAFEMKAIEIENAAAKIRGENNKRVYHQGHIKIYQSTNSLTTE